MGKEERSEFTATNAELEPIAVVGIGARFPGAGDAAAFWTLLRDGVDAISEVPKDRFDVDAIHDPTPGVPGKLASRWGGFIDGVDLFDAAFFGISPREAARMDPQQRLALKTAWEALDDGGQLPLKLRGTPTGVFVGAHKSDYGTLTGRQASEEHDLISEAGTARGGVAGRISYALGLEGPSLVVDTDRSSSLVAVHFACQSLRSGECSMALAGGVNLVLTPDASLAFSRAGMLAPDGRIKFCDARANGIVRSDGVAFVALKTLSSARRDGDPIHALILGSAMNHDGGRSGDLMTPSSASQSALLRAACKSARVSPADVQYVEAHGTGTVVGDPVEIEALAAVLQSGRGAGSPALRVGSVKTNIGHAEAAGGIAGLIKVVLAMKHRVLPASLHFDRPNPKIAFDGVVVQGRTTPWPEPSKPLIAGVTSLGLTGHNAHVVLGEAPRRRPLEHTPASEEEVLLTLSARDRQSLVALAERYTGRLREDGCPSALDIAYSAATRRSHLEDRLAVVGKTREALARELDAFVETGEAAAVTAMATGLTRRPKIAFVFPGHGSQWIGMGRELLESEPVFRASMLRCDAVVRKVAGWSLLEELALDIGSSRFHRFGIVQPLLVAVEIGLAKLWAHWGVVPDVIVGTSMGEVAAAHVAGVLSLEDAMLVICTRSRMVEERISGKAAIVEMGPEQARTFLVGREDRVWVAGSNGPNATLIAGEAAALSEVLSDVELEHRGGRYVKDLLPTHTPYVDTIAAELTRALEDVRPLRATVPMISTVTGKAVEGPELDGAYWVRNLREPFVFSQVACSLLRADCDVFVEVSPHPVQLAPISDLIAQADRNAIAIGSLRRDEPERRAMLRSLGSLHVSGCDVAWAHLFPRDAVLAELPTYPWKRDRHWWCHPGEGPASEVAERSAPAPIAFAEDVAAETPKELRESVLDRLRAEVARALGLASAEGIDCRRPFRELGLTSLMTMELAVKLGRVFGRPVTSSTFFNYPNVAALSDHLATSDGAPVAVERKQAAAIRSTRRPTVEPIAVVGYGCRLPGGVDSPEAYWDLLRRGVDAIREVPANRWAIESWYDREPGQPGKMSSKWGGFVEDIDAFDAAFFGISPREAEEMDPQQRLVMEVAWEALERAGQAPDSLSGSKTGVFLGMMNNNDYAARKRLLEGPSRIRAHHGTGIAASIAAGRLAYTLGLSGPAMTVDTACSSSLVAVHLAMLSLRRGECRMALAGGVNAILSPELTVAYSQAGMLSPNGRCRTFDASADGYVRSEGCGILVLKTLADAVASGDNVLAVLAGAAVNQDGRSSGLTAPNGHAQRAVIRAALAEAGMAPSRVDYVETHGTGTPLGDPIELEALGDVFGEGRSSDSPVLVGSVKTNIGHLEAAAGVAGLIKVILSLQHEEIPPHLHFERLNPQMSAEAMQALGIPTQRTPWRAATRSRVAGVSSFGFSGTNAHVVVEEAPAASSDARDALRVAEIVALSAKSEEALRTLAGRYATYLKEHPEVPLGDVAFTLGTGRAHHQACRVALVGRTRESLVGALEATARGPGGLSLANDAQASRGKVGWLLPGQGAQRLGMGRQLAAEWPAFGAALDRTCEALDAFMESRPLKEVMWAAPGTADAGLLDQTGYTQPALFAIGVALGALWRSWGMEPDLLLGHSIGELAAAHLAGVFSLEDAARLVAARARLMQALPAGGAMVSIAASEADVAAMVSPHAGGVSVAAVNGPRSVVISGDELTVTTIARAYADRGVRTKRLVVSHAFHSPLMDPMLEELRAVAEKVSYRAPRSRGASNVGGALWGAEVATADYWVRHVRQAVRFADGVTALYEAGARKLVELGPRATLLGMVPACLPDDAELVLLASMREDRSEAEVVLEALAGHHASGATIDWASVFPGHRRRVELPTYPWQKQRYWIAPPRSQVRAGRRVTTHALLGHRISVAGVDALYETVLSVKEQPWLAAHRVGGEIVVPAAALVDLLLAAAEDVLGRGGAELRGMTLSAPLHVSARDGGRRVHVVLRETEGTWHASVHSQPVATDETEEAPALWTLHASADVSRAVSAQAATDLRALQERCVERLDAESTYDSLSEVGLSYGPAFRSLRAVWRRPGEVLAHVVLPEGWEPEFGVHPAVLDGALQVAVAEGGGLYLPFAIERMSLYAHGATEAYAHVRYTTASGQETLGAEVTLLDARGNVLAALSGFRAKRTDLNTLRLAEVDVTGGAADSVFCVKWHRARALDLAAPPASVGRWVLVGAKDDELVRALSEKLGASGVTVRHVEWADLGEALPAEHVVCIWGNDVAEEDHAPDVALRLVGEGLAIVKAAVEHSPPVRLWWMTRGAMAVEEREPAVVASSSLWGFGRTLREEYPELECTLVDLPRSEHEAAVSAALSELTKHVRDSEREVAWRAGDRYVARLERVPDVGARPSRELRTAGTVLVTGGLGGLGTQVARALARRGYRHLLLTGRRGDRTPGAADIARELRSLGSEVTIAALDVSDGAGIAALLASVPASAPLRGVVHAAGVLDDGVLSEQTAERFARVMSPKVAGGWHLDRSTRDSDLDFFVLFSSVVGTVGSAGQAPYGAANAFMDGLAARRRASGLPAVSLAWGPWAEVGMAAELDPAQRQRWARKGFPALSTSYALALFEAAIVDRLPAQTMLVRLDLERLREALSPTVPSLWRSLVQAAPSTKTPVRGRSAWMEELKALPPARLLDVVMDVVRLDVAQVLSLGGPEAVASNRPLEELGLDSLTAIELRNVLGKRVGSSLPATLVFDYPTPSAIARFLVEHLVKDAPSEIASSPVVADASVDEPIAIVGFGCRFPGGVADGDSFWHLLSTEVDAISEVPKERWDIDAYYDPDPGAAGKMYTREGGFLRGIESFDADFFEISPREAANMDPQQRLLLETSWEALERAGISPDSLMGTNTGVFVGVMSHEYMELQGRDLEHRDGYVTTGSLGSVASGRISYALGLQGPSMTIDTACSSSLVTAHLACQSLRLGECDLALAGGTTLVLTPSLFVEFSRLRGLSSDGRCRSFDAAADGVSWSEGCGVIALKRLSDAERDGDRILAVIKGSATNQDGRSQGLTAPNGPAQQAVIRSALGRAKVKPAEVSYVEAHGTGTRLGDPIELQALAAVLHEGRDKANPLVVGSLKSNIGHTQAAAGVGGIIKTLLALRHEMIPRSLHFHEPSPHIPWSELPVRVASEAIPWKREPGKPRVAGISSFGISGTNAHLVLQEAPAEAVSTDAAPPARTAELVVLSAKTGPALAQAAQELAAHLRGRADGALGDVAATLARGRAHRAHRLAVVARSHEELLTALDAAARLERLPSGARMDVASGAGKLAWLFTGQGSQWCGMGRGLASEWPVFREAFARASSVLDAHLGQPLQTIMWGDAASLDDTGYSQPALFALEVALAALWRSWGVYPDIMMGHSVGELAAAHVAGVFSLEDGARLIAARARLMQALPKDGAMASIAASEAEVAEAISAHASSISIAAVNGPRSVVISGAATTVDAIAKLFADRGASTKRLAVSHAFHSPLMEPMLDAFRRVAASITYRAPSCPLVSNVTGTLAGEEVMTPDYWVEHVRRAVRFADGVKTASLAGARRFLELGPKATLLGLVPACLPPEVEGGLLVASMRADRHEAAVVLEALGGLHANGTSIDWTGVFTGRRRPVDLPTYPWQRQRHWVDHRHDAVSADLAAAGFSTVKHALLGPALERADGGGDLFPIDVSTSRSPWLVDHVVHDAVLFPGTGFLELALAVGQVLGTTVVSELTLAAPLSLPEKGGVPLQISVRAPDELGRRSFELYSRSTDRAWVRHAEGQLAPASSSAPARGRQETWPPADATPVDLTGLYERLSADGLRYGPAFRGLKKLWRLDDEIYAVVELPEHARQDVEGYGVHPALLDASLHALPFLLSETADGGVLLPFEWRDVTLGAAFATLLRVRIRIVDHGDGLTRVALEARDGAGELVSNVGELVVKRASADSMRAAVSPHAAPLFHVAWETVPTTATLAGAARIVAVVGGDGALAERLRAPRVADLETFLDGSPGGGEDVGRRVVVVDRTVCAGTDALSQAHRSTHEALAMLQRWLDDPRARASELVWVTEGAVAAMNDDVVSGLGHAALWGLVRSARSENPQRPLRLLDIEPTSTSARMLAALDVRGEPELVVRRDAVLAARLTASISSTAAGSPRTTALTWGADGTVLVTGGTGQLGAVVARHLVVKHGARHLVLTSRKGADAPGARELQDELRRYGAHVTLAACDVSKREELEALLCRLPSEAPLRAIVHCAGVLDDGPVHALNAERVDTVFGPKVDAATHLHETTKSMSLETFVLFSSVAGILGTAGQANYAAANTYLDALAAHRKAQGLAAQSLAWGLWEPSGTGMSAKLSRADVARIERQGIAALSTEQGLQLLDLAFERGDATPVLARLNVSSLDAEEAPSMLRKLAKGTRRRSAARPRPEIEVEADTLKQRLGRLGPADQRSTLLELVRAEVSAVFRLGSDVVVPDDRPLKSLGLDSLMAVELRDRLRVAAEVSLPATLVFDHPTPEAIADYLKTLLVGDDAIDVAALTNEDASLRQALATLPLSVLRQHGLLGRLLDLANQSRPSIDPPPLGTIDELSNEELAALVKTL